MVVVARENASLPNVKGFFIALRETCTFSKIEFKKSYKSETEEVIATLTPEESKSTNLVTDLVVPSETIVYTVLNGNVYQWDIRSMNKSSINIGANIQSISSYVIFHYFFIFKF